MKTDPEGIRLHAGMLSALHCSRACELLGP
jgi:hypothetical protein